MADHDRDIAILTEIIDALKPDARLGYPEALKNMLSLMAERRKLEDERERHKQVNPDKVTPP